MTRRSISVESCGSAAWAFLALAAVWGSSYMFIRIVVEEIGPFLLVFLRVGLAALVLLPVLLRHRSALAGRWRLVPLVALPQVAIPFTLISEGEKHVPSGLAAILVAAVPLWMVVLAPVLRIPRPTLRSVGGLVVGLLGVALLVGGVGSGRTDLRGALLILLAAAFYAVGLVAVRRFMTGVPPIPLTAATQATSAVVLLPFAAFDLPSAPPSLSVVGALAVLSVVCTALAFVLFNRLIADVGPGRASLVAYIAPIFAVGYGAWLMAEPIGVGTVAGLVLILGGSWITSRYARKEPPVPAAGSVADSADPGSAARPEGNNGRVPSRQLR